MDKKIYMYNISDESGPTGCGLILADSEEAAREKLSERLCGCLDNDSIFIKEITEDCFDESGIYALA